MSVVVTRQDATLPAAEQIPLPPLFRWPGGKRWLVSRLRGLVPSRYGKYIEPFFGGGALFFALQPERAVISDVNDDLMVVYRVLQRDPVPLSEQLRKWPSAAETYYAVRAARPTDAVERAARTVYLTTHAFNGIHRVNRKGEFNVPWGGRQYVDLGSVEVLRRYSQVLQGTTILTGDFGQTLAEARAGDFIYLDPPYTVAHSHNGFVKYNDRIFSWDDQTRLASEARRLAAMGCDVVISNAHHEAIRELYQGFRAIAVSRTSVMAADAQKRASIQELVFTNVPGVGFDRE